MCLLFTPGIFEKIKDSRRITVLQRNGTLKIWNTAFSYGKSEMSQRFDRKTLHTATRNIPFTFHGGRIKVQKSGSVWMHPHIFRDYSALELNLSFAMSMLCKVLLEHTFHPYAHWNSFLRIQKQQSTFTKPGFMPGLLIEQSSQLCRTRHLSDLLSRSISHRYMWPFHRWQLCQKWWLYFSTSFWVRLLDEEDSVNLVHYNSVKYKRVASSVLPRSIIH